MRVTCHFEYDHMARLLQRLDYSESLPSWNRTTTIRLKAVLLSRLFNEHIQSTMKGLLDNFHHRGQKVYTSVQFQRTGSKRRLLEMNAEIAILYHVGFPMGSIHLWTFYRTGDSIQTESCYAKHTVDFDELTNNTIPEIIEKSDLYKETSGRGFKLTRFICTFQPDHVAFVALTYQTLLKAKNTSLEFLNNINLSLRRQIFQFLINPNSTEAQQLPTETGYATDVRLQKVKIGWHATIYPNEHWQMLVSHPNWTPDEQLSNELSEPKQYTIYHKSLQSKKVRVVYQNMTNFMVYYLPQQAATYEDSGVYFCEVTSCFSGCPIYQLTRPRRLIVLPQSDILSVHFHSRFPVTGGIDEIRNDNFYQVNANTKDPLLPYLQNLYVYCMIRILPVWSDVYRVKFELSENLVSKTTTISYSQHNETIVMTGFACQVYVLVGPDPAVHPGPLNASCVVSFSDNAFVDEFDLRKRDQIGPLIQSRPVFVDPRSRPFIYTELTESDNKELMYIIRNWTTQTRYAAKVFHASVFGKDRMEEGFFRLSILAYLARPKARIVLGLFFSAVNGDDLVMEQLHGCHLIDLNESIEVEKYPELLMHAIYAYSGGDGYARAEFNCAIRAEHVALAIVVYNVHEGEQQSTPNLDSHVLGYIGSVIQYWYAHPLDEQPTEVRFPREMLATYIVIKLNMGWRASVKIGSSVQMLGTVPTHEHQIRCFRSANRTHFAPTDVSGRLNDHVQTRNPFAYYFRLLNITYEESGFYTCNATITGARGSHETVIVFGPRMLLVIPDNSSLKLLLNNRLLNNEDEWVSAPYKLRRIYRLVMTDSDVYVHCEFRAPLPGTFKLSYGFSVRNYYHGFYAKPIVHRSFELLTREEYILNRYYFTFPRANPDGRVVRILAICVVNCTLEQAIPLDLHTRGYTIKVTAQQVMEGIEAVRPNVFSEFVKSDNRLFQMAFNQLTGQTRTSVVFHKESFKKRQHETVSTFTVHASLGYPRGRIAAWSIFLYADGRLFEDPCRLVELRDLNDWNLPLLLKADYAYKNLNWRNFVQASFTCVLRAEHITTSVLAYTGEDSLLVRPSTLSLIQVAFRHMVLSWLDHPKNENESNFWTPLNSLTAYRVVKLLMGWPASVTRNTTVRMLGSAVSTATSVQCFYRVNQSNPWAVVSDDFTVERPTTETVLSFFLKKSAVQHKDSGLYACNVTGDDVMKHRIGFSPRLLLVLPDASLLRTFVFLELKNTEAVAILSFRSARNNSSFDADCDQSVYVYCVFQSPWAYTVNAVVWLMYTGPNGTVVFNNRTATQTAIIHEKRNRTYVYAWTIRTPKPRHVRGLLKVECHVKLPPLVSAPLDLTSQNLEVKLVQNSTIIPNVKIAPVIFHHFINTSRMTLQQALRRPMNESITSAIAFHSSGPSRCLLDGPVRLDFITNLGFPKGQVFVYLLYEYRSVVRFANCVHLKVFDLDNSSIPDSIQQQDIYADSQGRHFVHVTIMCPLLSKHFGILLVSLNTFNKKMPINVPRQRFLRMVQRKVRKWLTHPTDNRTTPFFVPSDSGLTYLITRICVRRRLHVAVNRPVVMFSILGPGGQGIPHCMYHRNSDGQNIDKVPISLDSHSFHLYLNRTIGTFELVNIKARLNDSGTYHCQIKACPKCGVLHRAVSHTWRVVVLPDSFLMRLSFDKISSDHAHSVETLDYGHVLEVYPEQRLYIHCQYQATGISWLSPQIQFNYYLIADNRSTTKLSTVVLEQISLPESSMVSLVYSLTVPMALQIGNASLRVGCYFDLSHLVSKGCINFMSKFITWNETAYLKVSNIRPPFILGESVRTQQPSVTRLLQLSSATKCEQWNLRNQTQQLINEGVYRGDYLANLGIPTGWTGVWLIYNKSSQLLYEKCQTTLYIQSFENSSDATQDRLTEWHLAQFTCVLQLDHQALFIYAMHSTNFHQNLTVFESQLANMLLQKLSQLLGFVQTPHGSGTDNLINCGPQCNVTYRFTWIRVGWRATVTIGSPIRMIGRLSKECHTVPKCIQSSESIGASISNEFRIERFENLLYFTVTKARAEFTDSGWFSCFVSNCTTCSSTTVFVRRQLLVLPDDSLIRLQLHPILNEIPECNYRPLLGRRFGFSCNYPITKQTIHRPVTHIRHLSVQDYKNGLLGSKPQRMSTSYSSHTLVTVQVNTIFQIQLPVPLETVKRWYVVCQLRFPKVCLFHDLAECTEAQNVTKIKLLSADPPRGPKIQARSIQTNLNQLTQHLQRVHVTENVFRKRGSSLSQLTEEGSISIQFSADVGEPDGWTFVWLFYVIQSTVLLDTCSQISVQRDAQHTMRANCTIQPGHVAIVLGAVNALYGEGNKDLIESTIGDKLLKQVGAWMNIKQTAPINRQINESCYSVDYRLALVRVTWKGLINSGDTIIMRGRMGDQEVTISHCSFSADPNISHLVPISSSFSIRNDFHLRMFTLYQSQAQESDTGYYKCDVLDILPQSPSLGMNQRFLHVLPTVRCNMSVERNGSLIDSVEQRLPDGTHYLLSNQTSYIQCTYSRKLEAGSSSVYGFEYRMHDPHTNTYVPVNPRRNGTLVTTKMNATNHVHVYRITGVDVSEYTGMLRVICYIQYDFAGQASVTSFGNKTHPTGPDQRYRTECIRSFTILEPANGELVIKTVSQTFQTRPVALGSKFVCTGGYGLPKLTYRWIRSRASKYVHMKLGDVDYASLLPADIGGWGGPKKPMSDMPEQGLEVHGPMLRIPDEPGYRGMSYLYTCEASNVVEDVEYHIKKTIYLTVSVCPTSRVQLDLTLLLSSKLMSACVLSPSPDGEIQFYGYYFLTFVRQLILGLPVEPNRVHINLIRDDIAEATASMAQSTPFWFNQSRTQIAQSLYSRHHKPITNRQICSSMPLSLEQVIEELDRQNPTEQDRAHLVLLTFDGLVNTTLGDSATRALNRVRKAQPNILLAWTHSSESDLLKPLQSRVENMMQPSSVVHILTRFLGVTDCHSCHYSIDDTTLQIERAQVFDQVCRDGKSKLPEPIPSPWFVHSVPQNFWFNEIQVDVTCVTNYTDQSSFSPISRNHIFLYTELTVCLSNLEQVKMLHTVQRPNLQHLEDACVHHLGSTIQTKVGPELSVTTRLTIGLHSNRDLLLCYQRIGEVQSELFDATNYVIHTLKQEEVNIDNLTLNVIHWPRFREGPALFQCTFDGFTPGLEVLLLSEEVPTTDTSLRSPLIPASPHYSVVARSNVSITGTLTRAYGRLLWLELTLSTKTLRLFCLVQPQADRLIVKRVMTELPTQTDHIRISPPVSYFEMKSSCPQPPVIRLQPDMDAGYEHSVGTELKVICELSSSNEHLALKLFFRTPHHMFTICHTQTSALNSENVTITVPCLIAAYTDKNCTQLLENGRIERSTTCLLERRSDIERTRRKIELTTHVQVEDYDGRVFCETIGHQTDHWVKTRRLISVVKTIRFHIDPQIEQFLYDPHTRAWECVAVAYPADETKRIHLLQATPTELNEYMRGYKVNVYAAHVPFSWAHQWPIMDRLEGMETVVHRWRITWSPRLLNRKATPLAGTVKARCSFGGKYADLITSIPELTDSPLEYLVKRAGETGAIDCLFRDTSRDSLRQIVLHRRIHTSWLDFDIPLGIVRMLDWTGEEFIETSERYMDMHMLTWWTRDSAPNVTLAIDHEGLVILLVITIHSIMEFDSGEYYCSASTIGNTFHYTEPVTNLIRGERQDVVIGQKILFTSDRWSVSLGTVLQSDRIHVKCVAWTTDPESHILKDFTLLPKVIPAGHNRTKAWTGRTSSIVVRSIDQYHMAEHSRDLRLDANVGCHLTTRHGWQMKKWIRLPKVICTAPRNLHWEPIGQFSYLWSTQLRCRSTGGCANMVFRWDWVAGPIPQLNNAPDACVDDQLLLSRLPRPGAYAFQCTATCVCDGEQLSDHVLASFFVSEDETEMTQQESADVTSENLEKAEWMSDPLEDERSQDKSMETAWRQETKDRMKGDQTETRWSHTCQPTQSGDYVCVTDKTESQDEDDEPVATLRMKSDSEQQKIKCIGEHDSVAPLFGIEDRVVSDATLLATFVLRRRQGRTALVSGNTKFKRASSEPQISGLNRCRPPLDGRLSAGSSNEYRLLLEYRLDREKFPRTRKHRTDKHNATSRIVHSFDDIRRTRTEPTGFNSNQTKFPDRSESVFFAVPNRFEERIRTSLQFDHKPSVHHLNYEVARRLGYELHNQSTKENGIVIWPQQLFTPRNEVDTSISDRKNINQTRRGLITSGLIEDLEYAVEPNKHSRMHADERNAPFPVGHQHQPPIWPPSSSVHYTEREKDNENDVFSSVSQTQVGQIDSQQNNVFREWWKQLTLRPELRSGLEKLRATLRTAECHWPLRGPLSMPQRCKQNWLHFFSEIKDRLFGKTSFNVQTAILTHKARTLNQLQITPGLVILPDTTTIHCPSFATTFSSDIYRPVRITWLRARTLDSLAVQRGAQLILEYTLTERHHRLGSERLLHPRRAFSYPPEKWSATYTLDIRPVELDDYGYYACVTSISASRTHPGLLNFTKLPPNPLCVVPQASPIRLPVLNWSSTQHCSPVPQPRLQSDKQNHESIPCLQAGAPVTVQCESSVIRLFCERADDFARGLRLIHTELNAHIYLIESGVMIYSTQLVDTKDPVQSARNRTDGRSKEDTEKGTGTDEAIISKSWRLILRSDHHNAFVRCESRPRLVRPRVASNLVYLRWLSEQLERTEVKMRLERSSVIGPLCVHPKPDSLAIVPEPSVASGHSLGVVQVEADESIQCAITDNRSTFPIMEVYSMSSEQQAIFDKSSKEKWRHSLTKPVGWFTRRRPKYARLLVPGNVNAGDWYYVRCLVPSARTERDFFVRIVAMEKTSDLVFPIQLSCIVVCLFGIVMSFKCVNWYVDYRKGRRSINRASPQTLNDIELGFSRTSSTALWIPEDPSFTHIES
ncbi:hypothetical protein EG68_02414 [Paragonimus skrjabini miyazakii]|uniref:Ig-like domain-containing protein n=1 Tax=Paragonimus skrjabini miyazakii TaxID=59628 RepID=A0A8S9Z3H5_9TREM|nr:hypothetical protein EG68_02414 [Paragonimus skrjabini miyazakii]